jgi:hypothetical protein
MTKMYESPFLVSRASGNVLKNKEYFNELVEAAGNVYTYIASNCKLLTHCF